jgi:hypothetical protein
VVRADPFYELPPFAVLPILKLFGLGCPEVSGAAHARSLDEPGDTEATSVVTLDGLGEDLGEAGTGGTGRLGGGEGEGNVGGLSG